MTERDLDRVSELAIRSKASWGYSPELMNIFAEELTITESLFPTLTHAQVATDETGKIQGYFTTLLHEDDTLELEHLFVEANRLRKGIGSVLFRDAVRHAEEMGKNSFRIVSDPNSVGFYEAMGAVVTGQFQTSIPGREIPVLTYHIDHGLDTKLTLEK